jgi:hypothetical protein
MGVFIFISMSQPQHLNPTFEIEQSHSVRRRLSHWHQWRFKFKLYPSRLVRVLNILVADSLARFACS